MSGVFYLNKHSASVFQHCDCGSAAATRCWDRWYSNPTPLCADCLQKFMDGFPSGAVVLDLVRDGEWAVVHGAPLCGAYTTTGGKGRTGMTGGCGATAEVATYRLLENWVVMSCRPCYEAGKILETLS